MKQFCKTYGERALKSVMDTITLNFGLNFSESHTKAVESPNRASYFRSLAYSIAYFKDAGFDAILANLDKYRGIDLSTNGIPIANGIYTEAVHMMLDNKRIDVNATTKKIESLISSDKTNEENKPLLITWLGKMSPENVCDLRDRAPIGKTRVLLATELEYLTHRLGAVPCRRQ
jgi:hypothetical protein